MCPVQGIFVSVLHGESSKRLATPRNTKDKKHLQSTQSAQPTNLTDQAPSTTERIAPINTAAVHTSAQQQPTISTHTRQGHHDSSVCHGRVRFARWARLTLHTCMHQYWTPPAVTPWPGGTGHHNMSRAGVYRRITMVPSAPNVPSSTSA